jgi:hypothetical protein
VNSCRRAGGALLLCLALLAADTPGRGIEEIRLALGDIGGEGWSVEGVEARLVWLDDRSVTLPRPGFRNRWDGSPGCAWNVRG